jgi:hypothetical protein
LIINSVFWADTANNAREIYLTGPDTAEIAFSDINTEFIYGGHLIDGGGDISGDPLFSDPGLLTLSGSSPCVNTGTDEYDCNCGMHYVCPVYDILGISRPVGGHFDMGAYEFNPGTGISPFLARKAEDWHSAGPNPFSESTRISYTLDRRSHVEIGLYNGSGELVQILLATSQEAGVHELMFKPDRLPAGIYFYRIVTETRQATGKMMLLR